MNDKDLMNEFARNTLNWLTAKRALLNQSKNLKAFLKNNYIGKTFEYNGNLYKITEIIWDEPSNLFGGYIKCEIQKSKLYKLLFNTKKFVSFENFYYSFDTGKYVLKD